MNPLKILFLSLLTIFLLPVQNLFAQYGYSSLNPKSDISLYPWETPDTSRPEEYCEDYSYSTDMSQVEVRFIKENNQTFQIACYDPQNSWMGDPYPMTYQFKHYTVTAVNYFGDNKAYEDYPQDLKYYCNIQELNGQITVIPNYTDYIRFTPIQIKSESRLEINCVNTMNGQHAQIQINYKKEENQTPPPVERIEGCTDSTALNYNPQANVHLESSCQYPPTHTPQDITGFFEKSEVQSGATTWTIRLTLNMIGATLDPSSIQTWNKFTAVSATTNDKIITLTLRQFDDQRLNVECTNYEVTIPRHALTTTQGDTNPNPISGNFTVVGCEKQTNNQDSTQNQDEENQPKYENTIKENNFYLSLYDTDENGKIYINLTNVIYILGFISFFLVLFFILFGFIKNSFLGKSKR